MTYKAQHWQHLPAYFKAGSGSKHLPHNRSYRCLSFIKSVIDGDPVAMVLVVLLMLIIGVSS